MPEKTEHQKKKSCHEESAQELYDKCYRKAKYETLRSRSPKLHEFLESLEVDKCCYKCGSKN